MAATFDALVELLFKYRPVVFERGELTFGTVGWARAAAVVLGVVMLAAAGAYLTRRVRGTSRDRAVLATLRVGVVLLLVLCLLQPQLVVAESVPRRNVVAVLLDDSRSMAIPDADGAPRAEHIRRAIAAGPASLVGQLGARYQVRQYAFANDVRRLTGPDDALTFDGARTRLGPALERVRQELDGLPLAGIVVIGDGVDESGSELAAALGRVRASGVPVFTVAVGGEPARDVQVTAVDVPRQALRGAALDARVSLSHRGLAGRRVQVVAEDEGRIVATREIELPRSGAAVVSLPVPASESGVRRMRFRVAAVEGDQLRDNDARVAVIRVDERPRRVLYFEGEPRFEAKFVRQALDGDDAVQVILLQRTAEEKYLRLGVRDSLELAGGFPRTRQELFAYDAIILGSVEASAFSFEQLRLIEEFVGERGGGLLLLGGRRAFAEGGYPSTPIAALSPFVIASTSSGGVVEVAPRLTTAGLEHPATRVRGTADSSAARWASLPAATSVQAAMTLKPGAVSLLAAGESQGEGRSLLAYHRFGRGRVAALAVQDSWLWQMHADVPLEDQTHETFWRQLLRWTAGDSPGTVVARMTREAGESGQPATVEADVRDAEYRLVNDARVVARVTDASGGTREVPMLRRADRDGAYAAELTPDADGLLRVTVEAETGAGRLDEDEVAIAVERDTDEYFDAAPNAAGLARIAQVTGGRSYSAANMDQLPRDIVYAASGTTTRERKDLWDAPAMLLALLGLLGAEWGYRRWRGLA